MKIGSVSLESPFVVAPMAGMTDSAFRRLVKGHGGCGLVVTEMVSADGLIRGIDRTLEYAEHTEEERPISIQIFGGDPAKMAAAAQVVEGMGADIVDVNMGCPVRKIAKHNAGCSLMREPKHAAAVVDAMVRAVKIPVTVKMRAGWNQQELNALELASRVADAGAAAVTIHGRTAEQSYSGLADWDLVARVAREVPIPVMGSGDCLDAEQVVARLSSGVSGVLVGRGVLRNPWILGQAADLLAGRQPREVTLQDRGQFLLDYLHLLLVEGPPGSEPSRFTRSSRADQGSELGPGVARGREKWVINKIRALCSWYSRGLEGGSAFRVHVNRVATVDELLGVVQQYFSLPVAASSLRSMTRTLKEEPPIELDGPTFRTQ
jgi:tRNA-dihydrouridine synthase B